jgi:hypothetical protein
MLQAYHPYPGCLFVTAPDVFSKTPTGAHGDAATFAQWPF